MEIKIEDESTVEGYEPTGTETEVEEYNIDVHVELWPEAKYHLVIQFGNEEESEVEHYYFASKDVMEAWVSGAHAEDNVWDWRVFEIDQKAK